MRNVWCVRAGSGKYASRFVQGGYAGIAFGITSDVSKLASREELEAAYRKAHPGEKSKLVIGQQVGQMARFLLEMQEGDYILTPDTDSPTLHYGCLLPESPYVDLSNDSPYPIRRRVEWKGTILRDQLSVPFQNTIRSSLTVFAISQREEFLAVIGEGERKTIESDAYDSYKGVLDQILQLTPKEFEILVGYLLTAVGFDGSEVTGKPGDGGVDATGILSVAGLAEMKIYVQAKRYKSDGAVKTRDVKELRSSIPSGAQGGFITTANFQKAAFDIANDPGFPHIGLINGHQLVDLLVEHWDDIPQEFQERLGLKKGLVRNT